MKRKVRIYKDPFGNGGYINKTAQWLSKAQEGAETGMTPVTAGILQRMQSPQPQQMQQQPQQPSQDDMLNTVVSLAQQGYGKDDITKYIISQYGVEEGTEDYASLEPQIQAYVDSVFQQIDSSAEESPEYNDENEESITEMVDAQDTYSEDQSGSDYNITDDIIMDAINEPSESDYIDDFEEEDEEEYRYGGIPNKRSFINKTVRKLRKAQQGDQVQEPNTANVRGTENNPTGITGNKDIFISGVKDQAQNHFLKEQAEQMYNNQFGQGMDQEAGMDYAQRGGFKMRRANRKLFGSPMLPPGVTSSKYTFGPLGGVRTAEVQYNPLMMLSMFPMMTFPGMSGGSSWSYNNPYKRKSTGRIVTEKISTIVNNKSTQDVANVTDSDAANKSAEGPCTEEQVKDPNSPCYDPMYTGEGPRVTNSNTNANTTVTNNTSNDSASSSTTPVVSNNNTVTNKPVVSAPSRNTPVVSAPDVEDTSEEDALRKELNASEHKFSKSRKDATYVVKNGKYYVAPNYFNEDTGAEKWYEVTDPERIKNIKKLKGDQEKRNQGLEGKDFTYERDLYGDWKYYDPEGTKTYNVTNKETLKKLNSGKSKSNYGIILKSKPGYYYRRDNAGNYIKFKGDPQNHSSKKTPVSKITKKSNPEAWNYLTKQNNAGKTEQMNLKFQGGGSINNPFEDQYGNLQKFIYGDEIDNVMLNALNQPINQSDLDYSDSKDVTDPYFKHGGLHRYAEGDEVDEPKTYNQEELDKILADKQKSWETDYQNKTKTAQQKQQEQQMQQYQNMQQYMNPMGSRVSGYGYRGAPMGGFGGYGGPGLLGAAGRLAGSFMGGRQSQFSPVGNPLEYAATAAGITKSGMLPTGMKYSKEKKQDGNFFERKLGFNKDKVWTIDYATPDQIKAGAKPGTTPGATTPGTTTSPTAPGLSGRDKRIAARDERKNRGIAPEADAEAFTGTLKGSTEPEGPSKNAEQELMNFQANQRKQGLTLDPKTQTWVKGDSPLNNIMTSPGMSRFQEADIVTGTPGVSVGNLPSQQSPAKPSAPVVNNPQFNEAMSNMMDFGEYPGSLPAYLNRPDTSQAVSQNPVTFQSPKSAWDPTNLIRPEVQAKAAPQSNLGPVGVRSTGMVGKSAEEIRDAYRSGTSNPTVINRGNTTYINAAGEPIDVNDYSDDYAYGGYIPTYMAYGGDLPQAGPGIDVSSVSFAGNPVVGVEESPTWAAMQYFNQNQNIKNPDADKFKNYTVEPDDDDLSDCTYEQKIDPTSKCYDPQTAQLKFKEEKGPAGQKAANIMGSTLDAGAMLADDMNYATERRTKYIPGMTEFAMGEKQSANEVINKGEFNARTGKEGIQGFEGVIRKGGAIKNKKSNASGHKIDMNDFQSLLKLAGLI